MRYPALASLLTLAAASTAHAAPTSPLHPLVPSELPASCRDHAAVPTTATTVDPDFAAHVSVASCLAETAMADLALQPDDVSLTSLDVAAAPSLEILEDVRAHGEDHWKAIADDRKADLLLGMVVRMRIATNDPDDHAGLEPKLARWIDVAEGATREAAPLSHREHIGQARGTLRRIVDVAIA